MSKSPRGCTKASSATPPGARATRMRPPYGIDTFMPSAVTVDHYRLRMKAGDHPFEIVLVERLEVTSDDVLFSSSHVSFLPRAA